MASALQESAGRAPHDEAPAEAGPQHAAAPDVPPDAEPYELAVVIPTFNERANVSVLVEALEKALAGIRWEAIFVDDDSPDGTADAVRRMVGRYPNVRCLQRIGRRGLSSACIDGLFASGAPYLAVMDADLQHDESILPLMLHTLRRDQMDVVVGSRYVAGGGTGDWQESRVRMGRLATLLGAAVVKAPLKDPMSGFFVLRRSFLEETARRISGKGFKILLDLFMSAGRPVKFAEVPYEMRSRRRGDSKLDLLVAWEYVALLAEKLLGRYVPFRFVMFVMMGSLGAVTHLAVLGVLMKGLSVAFFWSQFSATALAMTLNFFLNNLFTYRDRRLTGLRIVGGLLSFYVACGLGAAINVILAQFLFDAGIPWWLAGLIGALVGAVWNFAVSSSFTWGRPRPDH